MRSESGFTMVATLVATTVMSGMALVAVTAVRGDFPLQTRDLQSKRAYEAAKAGIEDYAFHLYAEPTYWTKCTGSATNAVNQVNSTTKRRKVPGDAKAEYAIELIPAQGKTSCSTTAPTESMIETSGPGTGSFRIRSNGYDGNAHVSIVTTFKRPSFLDYVYFTQLETSDPVSYGFDNPSEELDGAYEQCELTYEQGRYDDDIPGTNEECSEISFVSGDEVDGPMHTNDTIAVCGSPTFGRELSDQIEIGGKFPGYFPSCGWANPDFDGTRVTSASILVPPATNSKLKTLAEEKGYKFTGQVYICLEGTGFKVSTSSPNCSSNSVTKSAPANGVVYVENGTGCSTVYSPFTATYPSTSTCGNAYVRGTYTGQLTIAAQNDIVIRNDICRASCGTASGTGMLGLIANNFVRVFHPYPSQKKSQYSNSYPCGDDDGEERLEDLNIDAAILAINHSFIVDHYNCGDELDDLNVEGAIAQKFRGPVGTQGNTGYIKNYVYDDRLRYLEPPSFIEPTGTSWVISRQTED